MADINSKVAQIRQAVYGKDVRENIASGIEAINEEVEATTDRQDAVEQNEDSRISAENLRISRENTRVTSETGRVTAENTRVTEFNQIKDDYNKASKFNVVAYDDWTFTASQDTTTFTIDMGIFNPLLDIAELSQEGVLLSEGANYSRIGAEITLGYELAASEMINVRVFKGVINEPPTADGSNMMNGSISKLKLSADVVDKIDKVPGLESSLAEKVTKGEVTGADINISSDSKKIGLNQLNDEARAAIAGTAAVNAVPGNDSITSEKTAPKAIKKYHLGFTPLEGQASKNLFDKAAIVVGSYARWEDGTLGLNASYSASDYIRVEPNTQYYVNMGDQIPFYDLNKNYISGVTLVSTPNGAAFTTHVNAVYLRLSIPNIKVDTLQLEKGSVGSTYESYGNYKLSPLTSIKAENIQQYGLSYDRLNFIPITTKNKRKNLFDKTKVTSGYYVSNGSGNLIANANYSASDYVPIESNTSYTISSDATTVTAQVSWLDENKNYISGIYSDTTKSVTLMSPTNAKYVRFSIANTALNSYQIEEGYIATAYSDFNSSSYVENIIDKYMGNIDAIKDLLLNPFVRCNIKIIGDSITAGVGGTGYALTGETIPGTIYNANNDSAVCWANSFKDFVNAKIDTEHYVPMDDPNIKLYGTGDNFAYTLYDGTKMGWELRLLNTNTINYISFDFYGDHFGVAITKGTFVGIADVYVDDVKIGSIDGYNATTVTAVDIPFTGLLLGKHNVKIKQTNTKNASSTANTVFIEAIKIPKTAICKNWGISGRDSKYYYDHKETVIESTDDILIMQLGTNDRNNYYSSGMTKQFQRGIINYAKKIGVKQVIIMTANAVSVENDTAHLFYMLDVDKALKEVSSEMRCLHISNYDWFITYCDIKSIDINALLADGLHPNDTGYDIMYKNIMKNLGLPVLRNGMLY